MRNLIFILQPFRWDIQLWDRLMPTDRTPPNLVGQLVPHRSVPSGDDLEQNHSQEACKCASL